MSSFPDLPFGPSPLSASLPQPSFQSSSSSSPCFPPLFDRSDWLLKGFLTFLWSAFFFDSSPFPLILWFGSYESASGGKNWKAGADISPAAEHKRDRQFMLRRVQEIRGGEDLHCKMCVKILSMLVWRLFVWLWVQMSTLSTGCSTSWVKLQNGLPLCAYSCSVWAETLPIVWFVLIFTLSHVRFARSMALLMAKLIVKPTQYQILL